MVHSTARVLSVAILVAGCQGDVRDDLGVDAGPAMEDPIIAEPNPDAGAMLADAGLPQTPPDGTCPEPPALSCAASVGSQIPFEYRDTTVEDGFSGRTCGGNGRGSATDRGLLWVAPTSGKYRITTEGSSFDTVLFVRRGCDGQELACNDDVSRGILHSSVEVELEECEDITIVVEGFDANEGGEFALTISGIENACDNGMDDDGDGNADCADPDCFGPMCSRDGEWPETWSGFEWDMLTEVNKRRREGAYCEGEWYPAAPEFEMDEVIRIAARLHSLDMAEQDYFEHDSLDGRTFSDRMRDAGFSGDFPWGENIAYGYETAVDATQGLMESPGHCRNIMNPEYLVVGIGYAFPEGTNHYWTQDFAASH